MNSNNAIVQPRIVSVFSGCGGLDLGFHMEGYRTVWANDFSSWACASFKNYFGDVIKEGDITRINPYEDRDIPECDLVLGGFPCQDFSIIWKQPGLEGRRGGLYRHFLEFVDAKKPKAFVAENVKGLLTANKEKAIETIIKDFELIEPGYIVKPHLYNFAEYGVPQHRERVLIVGIRIDTGFDFRHPRPTHGENRDNPYVTAGEALRDALSVEHNNERVNCADKTRRMLELIPAGGNFTDIPPDNELYVKGMISHVYRRIHPSEPSKTIIAAGGGGTWGYHYPDPRPLTNRERARLQSFPDDFEFKGSVAEVRRQIGNAVPPEGVRLLARQLLPLFQDNYTKIDLTAEIKKLKGMSVKERLDYVTAEMNQGGGPMEFLFSNLPPIRTACPKFADVFYSLIPAASRLDIAVGYITADSLAELQQIVIQNANIARMNLVIGMHYLNKFTKQQYNAAVGLNDFLQSQGRGEVRLVTSFRFHGKLYSYSDENGAFAGIIGSDNLGSIVDSRTRTYEASVLLRERPLAAQMRKFIDKLNVDATDNIADCCITEFNERNTLLEDHENVKKVPPDIQADTIYALTSTRFEIPLVKNGSVPEKSNLNVFFGKGRLARATGVIQPRHWYETELIVPSTITEQFGYPQKDTPSAVFAVITDDGWQFSCKVSGDYSKNFRSEDDLKILGKWIKGRLENAGVLEVGHRVTADTFTRYGRDSFTFIKTSKTITEHGESRDLWYLDFGVR